jgi:fumarate reductase (CoM/CoB) subunit A
MVNFTGIDVDVLVVGSGSAGIMAAIRAKQADADVLLVTKGPLPSGNSCKALSGYAAAFGHSDPRDNPDVHFADVVRNGVGLSNQKLVRKWVDEICGLTLEMTGWGLDLIRDDGKFSQIPWEGHTYPRMVHHHRVTGKYLMKALSARSGQLGVRIMPHTIIGGFFRKDGAVNGAWAANCQTGELHLIRAKTVIVCTGGVGALYPFGDNVGAVTGEGYAFAFDAGAELLGMEFGHFLATPVFPEKMQAKLSFVGFVNGMINESRGRLYNGVGERFMYRYYPETGEKGRKAEELVRCIGAEMIAGRAGAHGGVYFDASDVPDDFRERERYRRFFELAERAGMNLRRDPLEIVPYPHDLVGGIKIDEDGRTNVRGLYAAGEAAGGSHGASRFGGSALSDCLVFGSAGGRNAAAEARAQARHSELDADQLEAVRARLAGWQHGRGRRPREVLHDLSRMAFRHLNMVRSGDGLNAVLLQVAEMKKAELPSMAVDAGEGMPARLREAIEADGQARLCELMARAALERQESRGGYFGGHYRVEFPERDDENWLKNIVLSNRGGKVALHHEEPVRLEGQSDLIRAVVATEWRPPNDPSHWAVTE